MHPGLVPRRGWCLAGQRLVAAEAAYSGGRHVSLIAALDHRGIRACQTVNGGVKKDDFFAFITKLLGPTLRPGKVIVMDNIAMHHQKAVAHFLERRGCRIVFLPPYSPRLNPIEHLFSKIKHLVRYARATCVTSLKNAFLLACRAVSPSEARHAINHAGFL